MDAVSDRADPQPRRVRSDAVRNRGAIVAAAAAALAEIGHTVDVRQIADRAGVGVGTVYRHFPTKEVLLETVLHEQFLEWAAVAAADAATHGDPWEALVGFLDDALARQACHLAVCERLAATINHPDTGCSADLVPVIEGLVARCHQHGRLAPGVSAADVSLLLAGLGQAVRIAGPDRPEHWRRLLHLTIHGIAA